ncbi:MAG: phosphoglucomutase [Coriobacteriia bacterium]|nr:MAG: phosphoglucomutase [Coriobacteriia bacterium]
MSIEKEQYERWLEHVSAQEAEQLREQADSIEELHDAFYRELAFGTAGLRGIIGLGPNRMNVYTVGKATQGLADYLNAHYENPSVAIARDSRNMGEEFVSAAACVLAANGIVAHVYRAIQPTPVLSFTVRDLHCSAGINVTASHNPAAYNGYKVYGEDGCQIASQAAVEIQADIDGLDFFNDVKRMDFDDAVAAGLIKWVDDTVVDRFIDEVAAQSVKPEDATAIDKLKIVYTPLNGTGLECVTRILKRVGLDDVSIVDEQRDPDGDFTTCPYPNPEDRAALELGLRLCERVNPDILLATDPDADRVGIAVLHDGAYELLTGNEVGVLLIDYIAKRLSERGEDLSEKLVVTTIVSTLMPDAQAAYYGFELRRVLTGFKYIGGQIALLGQNEADRFMFGFEESYGYMSGTYVRDKDAISASMLICEMAQMYKNEGIDLVEAIESLYERYGYYLNKTINMSYPGSSGAAKMEAIMDGLRTNPPQVIAGLPVMSILDYADGAPMTKINGNPDEHQILPDANVISFDLGDGVRIIIRPSGTEPKIKAYVFSKASTRDQAEQLLFELSSAAQELLD